MAVIFDRLLDDMTQNDIPLPYCSLSDHILAVSDIIVGVGPFPTCRVLSSSVDHSVKVRPRPSLLSDQHVQSNHCLSAVAMGHCL